jgi:hypothetical protein
VTRKIVAARVRQGRLAHNGLIGLALGRLASSILIVLDSRLDPTPNGTAANGTGAIGSAIAGGRSGRGRRSHGRQSSRRSSHQGAGTVTGRALGGIATQPTILVGLDATTIGLGVFFRHARQLVNGNILCHNRGPFLDLVATGLACLVDVVLHPPMHSRFLGSVGTDNGPKQKQRHGGNRTLHVVGLVGAKKNGTKSCGPNSCGESKCVCVCVCIGIGIGLERRNSLQVETDGV